MNTEYLKVARRKVLVLRDQKDFIDSPPESYLEWGQCVHDAASTKPLTEVLQVVTLAVCTFTRPPVILTVIRTCISSTETKVRPSTTSAATIRSLPPGTPMSATNANLQA